MRRIETLPPSICDLIHLRYLDLSSNPYLVSLPESIHKLRNLLMLDLSWNQSLGALPLSLCKLKCWYLNLSYCSSITSLPEGLGSMSSLRHLNLWGCDASMPIGIGKLTGLETLNWFVVGNWLSDGDNGAGGASISELQGLNQLRGRLEIHGLENVRNGEDAKEANLSSKTHLSTLHLQWDRSREVNNSKEVLEGLLWHPLNNNITCLEIEHYKAAYFPEVFLQNLKSLKSLEICGCDRLKSLGSTWSQGYSNPNASSSAFSSSHFHSSSLQELMISSCPELQFSEEDFHNLDALHQLTLIGLPQLTALPQGIQHLPMLRRLEILGCENLKIFPTWVKRRDLHFDPGSSF